VDAVDLVLNAVEGALLFGDSPSGVLRRVADSLLPSREDVMRRRQQEEDMRRMLRTPPRAL
jgi:hypothetical protein